MKSESTPIWLWPNLLSLDAPLVAFAWVWLLQQSSGINFLNHTAVMILCGAIWSIYVMDRIFDVWTGRRDVTETKRHAFSWKFRWVLLPMVAAVVAISLYQALYVLPATFFSAGLVVLVLSIFYFLLIPSQGKEIPYLKNLSAGYIFALGVAIPIKLYAFSPDVDMMSVILPFQVEGGGLLASIAESATLLLRTFLTYLAALLSSFEILFLGFLCMLNITAIDFWERSENQKNGAEVQSDKQFVIYSCIGLCLVSLLVASSGESRSADQSFFYVIALSSVFLYLINRAKTYFSLEAKRVLADITLLAPILIYYILTTKL